MIFGFGRKKPIRSGQPEWDGQAFDFDDPRVPPSIRAHVQAMAGPDWELYFVDTDRGGEWWLLDENGNLADGIWLEE